MRGHPDEADMAHHGHTVAEYEELARDPAQGGKITALTQRLDQHRRWVASVGQDGVQLSAEDLDLSQRDLSGQDLNGIEVPGGRFENATLVSADLSGGNLASAELAGVDLTGAQLVKANLD